MTEIATDFGFVLGPPDHRLTIEDYGTGVGRYDQYRYAVCTCGLRIIHQEDRTC